MTTQQASTPQKHGLEAEGFRFVKRGDDFNWRHPLELKDDDIDCTEMTDAEFEAAVALG